MTNKTLILADNRSVDAAVVSAKEFLKVNKYYASYESGVLNAIMEYILFSEDKTIRESLVTPKPSKAEKWLNDYNGTQLLKTHKLTDYGVWQVYGEDPNCDLGGSHSQPFLGAYEGTLGKVLEIAVTLPDWEQWGSGGSIRKVEVQKV